MRLTPSWIRSSSADTTEEHSVDGDASLDVPIYYTSDGDDSVSGRDGAVHTENDTQSAAAFVPESDATLLAVLDDLSTPVTVDELVDQLIGRAGRPHSPSERESLASPSTASPESTVSVETWATIHERLHEDRLPKLDADGALEFDPARGTIDHTQSETGDQTMFSPAVLGTVSIGLLFVLAILVTASMYTAVTVTVAATTFAVWLLPAYGVV
ncbi:uncharacterized protein Nmag_3280 [Natrialba magadii ATCC 43099]|uniref:Uncharacterized protein n=1 Tax=Natrialba magadii (strain ATCC 43099 / DSM 3394 / CCM 3739 / CIP 104546 / IAM 13178 / JCM 8861 / NBRC 102185 / NCIMB 2190 / MS3) TaxID=547559 RepID=D3SSI5_NATMM|nr:hypothetical protein [Natrialba magadii]ADD06830.1 uncharacterized protein Nmag_3280 [Natrialba magadii ATCC 43099]ELY28243.1 hypothetical protein C500_13836 [Natrialba magadii ATCC 43099]